MFNPLNPIAFSFCYIYSMVISGFYLSIYETTYLFAYVNPGAFFMYYFYLDSLNYFYHFITYGAAWINFFIKSSKNISYVNYGCFSFFFFNASSNIVKCSTNPTPAASWFLFTLKNELLFYKINFSDKTSFVNLQFVTIPILCKLGTNIFSPTQSISIYQFSNAILLINR